MTDYKSTLMYKEILETPTALAQIKEINQKTMAELMAAVKQKGISDITLSARGTSYHAGLFFKYAAEIRTPYRVSFFNPGVYTMYGGNSRLDNLVIGISQSGKAVDVLEVLKKAKDNGAITVAVTNDKESPMAKTADFHLFCGCGEEKSVAATKTFSCQVYILAYLTRELSRMRFENKVPERLSASIGIIDELSESLSERLLTAKDGFVLARGITSALAHETALKLQETCYIKMKGYAYSDFQHGPMAMVSEGTPIIFFAPRIQFITEDMESIHTEEVRTVIEKMKSLGGDVHIITDCEDYKDFQNNYILKGGCCETETMFVFAMLAQMTACKLSCRVGNNPDAPRALKKVTITR